MVDNPSSEPSEQTPASEDAVIDQAAIDAMLGNTGDDAQTAAGEPSGQESAPAADASQKISQSDIDALMGASSEDADAGTDASAPAAGAEDASPQPEPESRLDTLGRPFDEAAAAMQAAIEEEQKNAPAADASPPAAAPAQSGDPPPTRSFDLPEIDVQKNLKISANRVSMLNDVKLRVRIELGRTQMLVEDVLGLGEGSVVELDKLAGDPVDVYVNGRLIARGEVLVLNDNFCVRISEVFSCDPHRIAV